MAIEAVRETLARLTTSANALAVLGAAFDARASGEALDPSIRPYVDEALAALGLAGALDGVDAAELRPLLGELRVFALTNAKLLFAASRGAGWNHSEPEILAAAGDASAGVPRRLKEAVAPNLEGLSERLDAPGARFLDIGVGVATLAIEMARLWPTLSVVGIEPLAQALAMARERVAAARFEDRIELRGQAGEDLHDVEAFDLAWLPSVFVSEQAVPSILGRVHRALRRGGWLLFPMMRPGGDPLTASLARLRTAMFGGLMATPETVEALLRRHGFKAVRTLPGPPTAPVAMVAGRRES